MLELSESLKINDWNLSHPSKLKNFAFFPSISHYAIYHRVDKYISLASGSQITVFKMYDYIQIQFPKNNHFLSFLSIKSQNKRTSSFYWTKNYFQQLKQIFPTLTEKYPYLAM